MFLFIEPLFKRQQSPLMEAEEIEIQCNSELRNSTLLHNYSSRDMINISINTEHSLSLSEISEFKDDEKSSLLNKKSSEPSLIPTSHVFKQYQSLDFSLDSSSFDIMGGAMDTPAVAAPKVMEGELKQLLSDLLNSFIKDPRMFYFSTPGALAERCSSYSAFVGNYKLIDLMAIRHKFDSDGYSTPGEFVIDVRQMFTLALTFDWHSRKLDQFRIKERASMQKEMFDYKYFAILHEQSEDRIMEEDRRRYLDQQRELEDIERQASYSDTHSLSDTAYEERERLKKIGNDTKKDIGHKIIIPYLISDGRTDEESEDDESEDKESEDKEEENIIVEHTNDKQRKSKKLVTFNESVHSEYDDNDEEENDEFLAMQEQMRKMTQSFSLVKHSILLF